jgi:nucleoside-diphosphate-sugar epimerase
MKILLLGATGYIGNVLGEYLLRSGHEVTGIARTTGAANKLKKQGMDSFLGSFEEVETILKIAKSADTIINAAYGYARPQDAEIEIASGQSHLSPILKSIEGSGKRFIFISGSGVFPDSGDIVFSEETPFPPTNSPMVIARRNLEKEVLETAKSGGIHSIVLRPPTVYGRGGSFIVPRYLLDHALKTKESVYIQGCENKLWSAVDIDDLADLFLLALDKAPPGSLYNTGSQSGISTLQIAQAISRAAGLGGKTKAISLESALEIFGHWGEWWSINNQCTGEKAKQELGWKPHRPSMLEDIEKGSYLQPTLI